MKHWAHKLRAKKHTSYQHCLQCPCKWNTSHAEEEEKEHAVPVEVSDARLLVLFLEDRWSEPLVYRT